jgi:hypothetical protein
MLLNLAPRFRFELKIEILEIPVLPLTLSGYKLGGPWENRTPASCLQSTCATTITNSPKTGTVDGNQTRRDLIDSQISPSGGLYGITWYLVLGLNQ